jgi:hypothetical protein
MTTARWAISHALLVGLILMSGVSLACDGTQPKSAATTQPADEFEVILAVFTEMLAKVPPDSEEYCFIGVIVDGNLSGDADPSPALLEELRQIVKNVEPLSAMSTQDGTVRHARDGTPGTGFAITFIEWPDANTAVVQASRGRGGLSGSGWQYTLVREGDTWRITKKRQTTIS